MKKRLFIFNGIALILLYGFFVNKSDYFNFNVLFLGLLLLVGYTFFAYLYPKKWNLILYHSIFIVIYTVILLTSPMGITFALIGGVTLTIQIFLLFYLPALILLIWNIKQIRQYK